MCKIEKEKDLTTKIDIYVKMEFINFILKITSKTKIKKNNKLIYIQCSMDMGVLDVLII